MATILEETAFAYLSALTEEKIMGSFDSGPKINCHFITDIVHSVMLLGGEMQTPGIILAFGRYHAGDLSAEQTAGEINAIASQCAQQYKQENRH